MLKILVLRIPTIFIVFINLLVISNSSDVLGQSLTFIYTPQKFVIPDENVNFKDDKAYLNGSEWIVYSDRQYNKTYTKPNGGDVKYILDFLSPFYVAKRQGDYLNLYKKEKIEEKVEYLNYGWINMNNLLLWNHCLTVNNSINIKAIVTKNDINESLIADSLSSKNLNYDIFYVYKKEKNSVLLGRQPSFIDSDSEIKNCIITWVQIDDIWIWNNVVAIEPVFCNNNETDKVCIPAKLVIFSNSKSAYRFSKNIEYSKNNICFLSRKKELWDGTQFRFPILAVKNNIAKIVVFTSLLPIPISHVAIDPIFGYVPFEVEDSSGALFRKVLMYSSEDLAKSISVLSKLTKNYDNGSKRINLYNSWLKILRDEYYKLSDTELNAMEMSDIHHHFFLFDSGFFDNFEITLSQLLDPNTFPDSKLDTYWNRISNGTNAFVNILNDNSDYNYFVSNGIMYYWIDSDLLP